MRTVVLSLLLVTGALFACSSVFSEKGNGKIVSETRDVSPFEAIDACCGIDVELRQADKQSIEVVADENMLRHIITKVDNNTLYLSRDSQNAKPTSLKVIVSFVDISELSASSGSSVRSTGVLNFGSVTLQSSSGSDINLSITAGSLTASASSGSNINLSGEAKTIHFSASSGADIDAEALKSTGAELNASSGGSVDANVSGEVTADASSGGDIDIKGNPATKNVNKSSGGDVSFK